LKSRWRSTGHPCYPSRGLRQTSWSCCRRTTKAQLDAWINWYIGGLDNLTNWEMNQLSTLGFTGYFETVTPGSGSRPSDITADENANLGNDDNTTEVGAVWR
jgi:hypothetical protein